MRLVFIVCLFILTACSGSVENNTKLDCPIIEGVDDLLGADAPNLIVFGEIHGTEEVPVFIGDVVCRSIELGYPTVLALEFSESEKQNIDTYLADPNEATAKNELLKTNYWRFRGQDGKTSKAMFQLLQRSKNYKIEGYDIELVLFDVAHDFVDKFQGKSRAVLESAREFKMAENLQKAINNYPNRKIIVLTGNYHSPLWHHSDKRNEKFTMTSYLPRDMFLTLNINSQPGTVWTWARGLTKTGGKVYAAFLDDGKPSTQRAIHIFNKVNNGYDGLYYTVTKTASEPTNQ